MSTLGSTPVPNALLSSALDALQDIINTKQQVSRVVFLIAKSLLTSPTTNPLILAKVAPSLSFRLCCLEC